jgi:pimeloyl-ACP methyl ester carboxylesterase
MPSSPITVDLGPCRAMLDAPEAPARVILLPGALYSIQAPLLWFAREIALARGAGVLAILDRMPTQGDPFEWARDRAKHALDFRSVEHQVVVGKSLASGAAGLVSDRALPALWLTPLLDQASVLDGLERAAAPTLLVGGTADETWQPSALPGNERLEVVELPDLDHSLQVPGDPAASARALERIVGTMDRYLAATLAR